MGKYDPLTRHLSARKETRVEMRFADLEKVLGFRLPNSARTHRPWWANTGHGHVQARGWLDAGFESQEVDLAAERLVFIKLNEIDKPAAGTGADHPLWGLFAGQVWVEPGYDLTQPADPDWGDDQGSDA